MAFSVSNTGSIIQDFNNTLNEAFGGNSTATLEGAKANPDLFLPNNFGAVDFDSSLWTGNAYHRGRKKVQYGFATVTPTSGGSTNFNLSSSDVFYLQTAPQSIQQKEIFGTSVQATRKGVIVESEGVVFKEIIISGNTGIFPGERGGSNTPSPNFSDFTQPPSPPSGVDPDTGASKRSGVGTITGYEEFMLLRQFFLNYARQKVESKGAIFFAFLNQKDNQYFVVEPLEFTMSRDARSPLTYNYRIVLKAIAQLDDFIKVGPEESAVNFFDQIANVAANITATIDSANEVINAATNLLVSITQALDNTFLTPLQQLKQAVNSVSSGINTVLSLPASLARNAENVSNISLAVAKSSSDTNTTTNNFATSQKATNTQLTGNSTSSVSGVSRDDLGEVTNTGPSNQQSRQSTAQDASTINGRIPNLLDSDGNLSKVLTPEQYTAIRAIVNQLADDPIVPLPRSFVEALKTNTMKLRNDLADSIGAGDDLFDDIYGRTVTHPPPPLADPTIEQFRVLGALQDVIRAIDQILSNNDFFESDAEEIYTAAQQTYGQVSSINKPETVREVVVESGDSLERIALREYGDALRWVDIVILNKLKAPYILNNTEVPEGVRKPGDKLLVGNS